MDANDLLVIAPVLALVAGGILLPLTTARSRGARGFLAAIALVAIGVAALAATAQVYDVPGLGAMKDAVRAVGPTGAFGVYEATPYAVAFQLVFLLVAALVVLASPSYIVNHRHQGEYYALLLLSTAGMVIVAASRDLVTLFVAFELSSFATFALAGWFKHDAESAEASFKYFIVSSLSAALTLFGISLFYGLSPTGNLSFTEIGALTQSAWTAFTQAQATNAAASFPPLLVFAWAFLLAGFGFKIALVPFHNWAPDVYDGSPSTVSAFLASGSKKMGFAALFKLFLVGLIAIKANWFWVAGVVAVVTMTVGNVIALSQTNVKRMLAYSSIAQAGYMLIALPIATNAAIAGGIFQIFTHAIMKTGAFLVVAAFATIGVSEMVDDWRGLGRRSPLIGVMMALFLLSLAGIPPLAGFTSKFVLFNAAIGAGGWFTWLAVAGILNSVISLYYYARVIRVMWVDDAAPGTAVAPARLKAGVGVTVAIVAAGIATVLVGVWPAPFIDLATRAAHALPLP